MVICGKALVDLAVAVDDLRSRGYHRVLCEGGPTLLGSVVGHGVLDELCLTISPVLVGGTIPRDRRRDPAARRWSTSSSHTCSRRTARCSRATSSGTAERVRPP